MQRLSDLLAMSNGIMTIGQAWVQLTCNGINHHLRTSSVARSLQKNCEQLCGRKSSNSFTAKSVDYTGEENAENIASTHLNLEEEKPPTTTPVPSNNGASITSTKRSFSTCPHHFTLLNKNSQGQAFHNHSVGECTKHYHTSSFLKALSTEELASLAKLKQSRLSKASNGNKPSVKVETKQNLNEKSRERRVPASRIGRIGSFGGLAAGLAFGTLSDYAKKTVGYDGKNGAKNDFSFGASMLFSEANLNRIVSTLCTVRGAALKLGQMLSLQDSSVVDPRLLEIFDRVRQSADFMPASQMKKVLVKEFGDDWRSKVKEFDEKPFAAASIGQVHRAVLHDGREVAMKIQYPGVAESINSDINNLVTLLKVWNVFPEQLFIDKFIDVARMELSLECDYIREAEFSEKFRKALEDEEMYGVPAVIPELSGKKVLTTELISGIPIDKVVNLSQDERNFVAAAVLRLVLREVFEFGFMQTDPNWANFFYNQEQQKLWLLDFGASRYYRKEFVDEYIEIVKAASVGDRDRVLKHSLTLKFLTGYEPKVMEEAHIDAVMIVGEPFITDEVFDFASQSTSNRIMELVPTFLKHRLTPPPEETYSLHRKLSGAFLVATKLKAKFACKKMFDNIYENYWNDKKQ